MSETRKDLKIDDAILTLADQLKPHFSADAATFANNDAYRDFIASHGIDLEVAEKVEAVRPIFITAAQLAHGEAAIAAAEADSELKQVTTTIPMFSDSELVLNFTRSRDSKAFGTETTTYGLTAANVNIVSTGNRGALAKTKTYLKDLARDRLAPKS